MGNKAVSGASGEVADEEGKCPEPLDSGKSRVASVGCTSFPASISRIVGEYLSDHSREYVEAALSGEQLITLCLVQNPLSEQNRCWYLGFLGPNHQWKSFDDKIDKQFLIEDHSHCLRFLSKKTPNYCPLFVEILLVNLDMTSNTLLNALIDLRVAVRALQGHLNRVKHLIVSIEKHASCCFKLEDDIDWATGVSSPVNNQQILLQIIDDLDACWKKNHAPTVRDLLAFYFNSDAKPVSEKYLAKFVILVNDPVHRVLCMEEAPHIASNKIMWANCLKSSDDFDDIAENTTRLCHAVYLDDSTLADEDLRRHSPGFKDALCFQNNPILGRINIRYSNPGSRVNFLQSSAPLTATAPFSALVELTLEGGGGTLHLQHFNNGDFPLLTHLTFIGGTIIGHLDSQHVPRLKTLTVQLEGRFDHVRSEVGHLIQARCQALIDSGRPWQFVATPNQSGWSLASYDAPISNPQDEEKEDSAPRSLPLIKELLLVASFKNSVREWQKLLDDVTFVKDVVDECNGSLLKWKPECVEKITAFSTKNELMALVFDQPPLGKSRILSSLICHGIGVKLDGTVLPCLQLLEINRASVILWGCFLLLKTLSFHCASLESSWQLRAPLLESLRCHQLRLASNLSLNLQLLPHLSYLHIIPQMGFERTFLEMRNIDSDLGLSRIKHVIFDKGMTLSPYFHQCHIHRVSHLELTVDVLKLPACWKKTEWLCETLTVHFYSNHPERLRELGINFIRVPSLLPRVKKLTVTAKGIPVLINSNMPELTECTVPSSRSLGENFKCPALQRIRFTDELSESEKKKCLNRATYVALGAKPRDVIFAFHYRIHTMDWSAVWKRSKMLS